MNLSNLIDRHRRFYERTEKKNFDKARRYYRGEFYTSRNDVNLSDGAIPSFLCSKNLIYAIADTAVSALLGPNPKVAANPRNRQSQEAIPLVNGLMEYVFDANNMRRRAATALIDAVLCKRGVFKTGWDMAGDKPVVRVIEPGAIFFDQTVRDVDDIRYWLEAAVIPWTEFQRRVRDGFYKSPKIADVTPDRYPKWITDSYKNSDVSQLRDAFEWVTVWEYYDRETNKVVHYVRQADAVVFEQELDYIPYSMFTLNQSAVDCLGLSEVQLVLNQQETINDLLTHMKQIVYLMIPRILFNSELITEEDLNKAVEAATGSFVPISPTNAEGLRTLSTLFYEMPMPQVPAGVENFIARQEGDAAFISALAEAARGQVAGARTATEMAIIDAQMRTRLATREGHINTALQDVAEKCFFLSKRYMKDPKLVAVSGHEGWSEVSLADIHEVDVNFSMVSYNPIRQNPSVMAETLLKMFPVLAQDPNINKRALLEELVTGVGLSTKLLIPKEELEEQEAMAQQMMMAQMMGGAGGLPPGAGPGAAPPGAPSLPPVPEEVPGAETTEAATQNVPSDVMAAMGPTPVPVA
jgi:hypothetical protein